MLSRAGGRGSPRSRIGLSLVPGAYRIARPRPGTKPAKDVYEQQKNRPG
jgi:hypothetical protein